MFKPFLLATVALFAAAGSALAQAPLRVDQAWVRPTVAQQTTTAAYMTLTSLHGTKLIGASSPLASDVQLHEMRMDGNVMKMRQVDVLALPAGLNVTLAPGSLHLMLLGLKKPVAVGDVVPIQLVLMGPKGRETMEVSAVARKAP